MTLIYRPFASAFVPRFTALLFVLSLAIVAGALQSLAGESKTQRNAGGEIDFNRDIRTVLSDKCFLCHGPDEATREADLRLDVRDYAIDSAAIAPGSPAESELIARITSDDSEMVMPPPITGKQISASEAKLLSRWIEDGAAYDDHWAFVVPKRPALPNIKERARTRNEIDHFVFAKLEANSMSPSRPASPEILARRLALDLTGLPPTIEQLDRITETSSGDAIDSLAKELMSSQHFGERWGRWWLDAARYADSAGYEKDMQREVWLYRDWVIDAMNRDLPYDEFISRQIAGDLLADKLDNIEHSASNTERPNNERSTFDVQSLRVATGFLRNSMANEEGGADPEQFRIEGMFDRMDAIGKAILGITTQCAQCHTHKYDPLSHREYYQMFAALNDFHEACITVFTPEQAEQRDHVIREIDKIENEIRDAIPDWREQVGQWADSIRTSRPEWHVMKPTEIPFEGQKFRVLDDGSIISESYAPTKATNDFSLTTDVTTITAIRIDALTHGQLPRGGPGRSIDGTGALSEFKVTVRALDHDAEPINVKFVRAIADVNPDRRRLKSQYRERDPEADKRVVGPIRYAIDDDEKTAWTTDLGPGRSNQPRHAIFVPESPIVVNGQAKLTFTLVQNHGGWNSDDNQNFLLGRYRFSITSGESIPETTIESVAESVLNVERTDWSADDWKTLFTQWRKAQTSLAAQNTRIEKLWGQFPETSTQLVAQARPRPRETFVLTRGDFLNPSDRVEPNVPAFLHPLPTEPAPARLRFAKWLSSKDSPTTARVIVNRVWQAYFGRGLVTTPEDFGFQSAEPSHPKLLDFLARELMDNNWSLKHIHRLIVNSATYRQSSTAPPEAWQADPDNKWLARGPRVRVEAEMVRDIALAASGLLKTNVGGPSVYPPAPEFLFQPPTSYGPKIWDFDTDSDQYRRSLYVHQYRSVPYPPMQVFDAPKGDAACVRRSRSNTPLQALVLLNEPQFVAAARGLASRVIREETDDTQRVIRAFRLCTSRRPDAIEIELLQKLLTDQRQRYLGQAGEAELELAAWMAVSRAILNLDETITKS